MKYIDAEKLIAYFKKKMESYKSKMIDPTKYPIGYIDLMALLAREYQAIIANVESFRQEQPEVDLEKEYKTWWNSISGKINVEHIMEWYMHETARYFYELGRNTRKEENKWN